MGRRTLLTWSFTQKEETSMADGYNSVTLLGNLGADPGLRFTQGGQAVLNMRLATTESYLDKDKVRRERTDWHNVVVWGKHGEALTKFLKKGSRVFVEGSLRTSSYEDRDGNKHYKTEVLARDVIATGGGGERREDGGTAPSSERRDQARQGQPRTKRQEQPPPQAPADDFGYDSGDDIPF